MMLLMLASAGHAQEVASGSFRVDLRGGVQAATGQGSPMICAELDSPWVLGFDGCGSGGGFLYPAPDNADEMVHLRLEATIPVYDRDGIEVFLQPGAGIAEIERGADRAGFLFGRARSADQREGAGPEAAVSGKVRAWLHERFYVTAEISAGTGYIPSAPVVLGQSTPWVPFGVGSVGLGF